MKKFMLTGIIVLFSIMALAALTYGQTGGHAGHGQPAAPGSGPAAPGGHDHGGGGAGPAKMGGCPMMSGQGMMGGHGMMGGQGGMMGGGQGMMAGRGMGGDRMMEVEHHLARVLDDLNLDEPQKKAISEIRSTIKKDTIRKMADIRIARIELSDLLLQDLLDLKAVEAKVKQLGSLRTEMHLSHIKALENIKAKLTPDQRKKLKEHLKTGPMMMMHE
ncbi:MAG: Spy/CpxP family protein refolding chaperone [Deltaproteobacteria bacterium]|nr:Spy/CpxP family protein refolding chaperone [Deltaproteobacteria bacterium]